MTTKKNGRWMMKKENMSRYHKNYSNCQPACHYDTDKKKTIFIHKNFVSVEREIIIWLIYTKQVFSTINCNFTEWPIKNRKLFSKGISEIRRLCSIFRLRFLILGRRLLISIGVCLSPMLKVKCSGKKGVLQNYKSSVLKS